MQRELDFAKSIALQAGQLILAARPNITVKQKIGEGPVTDADIMADDFISAALQKEFPLDAMVTEESFVSGASLPTNSRIWYVDPIDGTADFISGSDDFAVMIGLALEGEPVLGVVYQPCTNILWSGINLPHALQNFAAREQGEEKHLLDIRARAFPIDGPTMAISRHYHSKFAAFVATHLNARNAVQKGSVGLKMMLIADAVADLYIAPSKKIKVWDTCGPEAILRAAGGVVHNFSGKNLSYKKNACHEQAFYSSTPAFAAHAQEVINKFAQS